MPGDERHIPFDRSGDAGEAQVAERRGCIPFQLEGASGSDAEVAEGEPLQPPQPNCPLAEDYDRSSSGDDVEIFKA